VGAKKAGNFNVGTSRHNQVPTLCISVSNLDPSGQNWNNILCQGDTLPTCWLSWQCWQHVGNTSATCQKVTKFGLTCVSVPTQKSTPTQEFCIGNHQQIVDTVVCTDTVVHTPWGGNTVGNLNKSKSSGHVNVSRLVMLVVLLLLPISLAVDDGEFDHCGGGGGGGGLAAAAVAAGAAVDNNLRQKRLAMRALMVA
jgi:hypothetical protein